MGTFQVLAGVISGAAVISSALNGVFIRRTYWTTRFSGEDPVSLAKATKSGEQNWL